MSLVLGLGIIKGGVNPLPKYHNTNAVNRLEIKK